MKLININAAREFRTRREDEQDNNRLNFQFINIINKR